MFLFCFETPFLSRFLITPLPTLCSQGGPQCAYCATSSSDISVGICQDQSSTFQCGLRLVGVCVSANFVNDVNRIVTIAVAVSVSVWVLNLIALTFAAHKTVSCVHTLSD